MCTEHVDENPDAIVLCKGEYSRCCCDEGDDAGLLLNGQSTSEPATSVVMPAPCIPSCRLLWNGVPILRSRLARLLCDRCILRMDRFLVELFYSLGAVKYCGGQRMIRVSFG